MDKIWVDSAFHSALIEAIYVKVRSNSLRLVWYVQIFGPYLPRGRCSKPGRTHPGRSQSLRTLEINIYSTSHSALIDAIYIKGEKQSTEASLVQMFRPYPVGAVPNQDVLNLDDLEALEP